MESFALLVMNHELEHEHGMSTNWFSEMAGAQCPLYPKLPQRATTKFGGCGRMTDAKRAKAVCAGGSWGL